MGDLINRGPVRAELSFWYWPLASVRIAMFFASLWLWWLVSSYWKQMEVSSQKRTKIALIALLLGWAC